jgi:hypothetical protein
MSEHTSDHMSDHTSDLGDRVGDSMSDDDRFVGRAGLPPRQPYDPPTEPLPIPLAEPPHRRPVSLIAALAASAFLLLLLGVMAGFALSRAGVGEQTAAPPPPPAVQSPKPSPTPEDTPKAATERFLNAVRAGDEGAIQRNLCGLLRNDSAASKGPGSGGLGWLSSMGTFVNFKIGEEKVSALGASVAVELTVPIVGTVKFDVWLVREEGGWRVCGAGPS